MTELFFSAQYQQEPIPLAGNIIKAEWFKEYEITPAYSNNDLLIISLDTAMKGTQLADYSVATVWLARGDHSYLLDLWRECRLSRAQACRMAAAREVRRGVALGRRQGFRDKPDPRSQSGKPSRYRDKPGRRQADTRRQDLGAIRGRRGILPQGCALAQRAQGRATRFSQCQV